MGKIGDSFTRRCSGDTFACFGRCTTIHQMCWLASLNRGRVEPNIDVSQGSKASGSARHGRNGHRLCSAVRDVQMERFLCCPPPPPPSREDCCITPRRNVAVERGRCLLPAYPPGCYFLDMRVSGSRGGFRRHFSFSASEKKKAHEEGADSERTCYEGVRLCSSLDAVD